MDRNGKVLLEGKKLFVLDMDGTFYLGGKIIDGSLDFIRKLQDTGRCFLFFTNNSSKTPDFYIRKLHGMGCDVDKGGVVTSGDVTIEYLKRHHPGKSVYLMGTALLCDSFAASDIPLYDSRQKAVNDQLPEAKAHQADRPDIVVAAFDTGFTYEKISEACRHIRNGALFIATHMDLNCPTEDGFIPDCGALCAMITASTGIHPKYLGKPCTETLDAILAISGCKREEIVFVGDRLYTDIAIGVRHGVTSILVLSGETRREDLEVSEIRPDWVVSGLAELTRYL